MPAEAYDTGHAYDTPVPYDGTWGLLSNTPSILLPGSLAYVEIKCLPRGVFLPDGSFFPETTVLQPNNGNLLTPNQADLESGITNGWVSAANAQLSASFVVPALHGQYSLQMKAIAPGGTTVNTPQDPTAAGSVKLPGPGIYTAVANFRAGSQVQPMTLIFSTYDNTGNFLMLGQSVVTDSAAGWVSARTVITAPARVASGLFIITWTAGTAGEIHYADQMGVFPGVNPVWSAGVQPASWSCYLAESAAFNDPTQYYQIQEVFYDGHRNTYKVRIPSTGGPNFVLQNVLI